MYNKIYFKKKTIFQNFMKWGLKGGISINTDSGPLGYVLWCCGSRSSRLFYFYCGLSRKSPYVYCKNGPNFCLVLIPPFQKKSLNLVIFRQIIKNFIPSLDASQSNSCQCTWHLHSAVRLYSVHTKYKVEGVSRTVKKFHYFLFP